MAHPPLARCSETFKALANPTRLRILAVLRTGGLCVCQVTAVLELAVSTVSAHLAALRRAGLIAERRDGRWVSYSLAEEAAARELLAHVWRLTRGDARLARDGRSARAIRSVPPERLSRLRPDAACLRPEGSAGP